MLINSLLRAGAPATEVVFVRNELSVSHSSWMRLPGVGAALAFTFWSLRKLRLGYAAQGSRSLELERRAERKRIARELHDTLLQGLQGILLEFEVLSSSLPEEDHERAAKIERKLRHIVMDGRNAINALRLPGEDEEDWMAAIVEMGEHAASDSEVSFKLKIQGEPWNLPMMARIEVLAIVREGLRNAFEHSHAKAILVFVRYTTRGLKISIQDNGIGVSEQYLKSRQKEGHWGIAGMRERAAKLGGQLTIRHAHPRGTTVELVLPRQAIRATHAFIRSRQPSIGSSFSQ